MDKSILLLIAAGIALAFLHMPEVTVHLGIITCLVMASIRVAWMLVQAFAQPFTQPTVQRRTAPVRNV